MGEHKLILSDLKRPLFFKDEEQGTLKLPKALLKKLSWKDKDKIGIIFETRCEDDVPNPKSIRLVNLTKYPDKELEFEAENIQYSDNLMYKNPIIKRALQGALRLYKLNSNRHNNLKRRRDAEKYLYGLMSIKYSIWLYNDISPLKFIPIPIAHIEGYYRDRHGNWDYQTFCKEHYIPREYKKHLDILYGNKNKRRKVRKKRSSK